MISLGQVEYRIRKRNYMEGERCHQRIKKTGEIFTPTKLVQRTLKRISIEDFKDPTKTFLDPTCGDGQFLGEILIKKIKYGSTFEQALNTLYGVDLQPDNVDFCRNHLLCGQEEFRHIVERNIVCADALTYHFRFDGSPPVDKTPYELFFE